MLTNPRQEAGLTKAQTPLSIFSHLWQAVLPPWHMKIEGVFDTEILLGKSKENRPGVTGINVTLNIDSDMTKDEKKAFAEEIESRCPVSDNIENSTPVKFEVL
ncbi:MAG: OsmC family protein [Deltaproteobacteria bacterium]|nr:OsmC family protein [Deltaproteobacteria bacterium]